MDIAALSISMSQVKLGDAVGLALVKKAMNVSQENIQELTKMMEHSANPNLGGSLDLKA